jgi:TetR/AcrR family transcriptional repressor of nem operon
MTSVGRPRQFDRDEALEKAMQLFWSRGYQATGLRDLLDHMGIGRQSLYDTFGDKHCLFIEAVEHYNRRIEQGLVAQLNDTGSPLERIRKTIRSIACSVTDSNCRGCLLTNTLVESAPHDPEIAAAAKSMLTRMEGAFRRVLKQAVDIGELPNDANVRGLARFLTSTIQGLVVMGKASVSRAVVADIVNVALSVL